MPVKILIINSAEPEITEFCQSIEKVLERFDAQNECSEYKEAQNIDLNRFDGIIISGSPQGDDIVEHHAPYFEWIKKSQKPLLGICAGHHITGWIYGSQILRSVEPESGIFEVNILADDPLLNGIIPPFRVKQMHNDSITLPENFIQLATSPTCKNQLMKHIDKPLYTCQFHPEFYNHELFRNFVALC